MESPLLNHHTMPSLAEPPIVTPMANGVTNEVNGSSTNGSRPYTPQRTPSLTCLSLTEYSANPSPPSEEKRARMKQIVPDEFLLPNGYPDVWLSLYHRQLL